MKVRNDAFNIRRLTRCVFVLGMALILTTAARTAFCANLTLAWDANSEPNLSGYLVFCGESSGHYSITKEVISDNSGERPPTTCEFTGMEEGATYYFTAIAFSENGQSDYSPEIRYTVPTATVDPKTSDDDKDGYSENQGDCNDNNASVNPGAADVCGDGIDQDCNGVDLACPDNNSLIREAQYGDMKGSFIVVDDSSTASGRYVYVPNGDGNRIDGADENQKITFTFNVAQSGTYRIKGTVYAANGSDDSFWVKVNGNPAGAYLWDVLQNTSYKEDYVNDRNGADPVEVSLTSGLNTVAVYLREDGTRLERLELEPVAPVAQEIDKDGDGYAANGGDCNDNDEAIYPGAEDICGDGIDQDCNGRDSICVDYSTDTDHDGLTDYEERNTYFTDPNKADTDGDTVTDGDEIAAGFDPNDAGSKPDSETFDLPLEAGEIEVDGQWKTVLFDKPFDVPVVIANVLSYSGQDPAVIRIRNVTQNGFEVRVQEWDYLDGNHPNEKVNYVVVESGTYELPGGTRVEAARFTANAVSSFAAVPFKHSFGTAPVVMTAITTANEGDAVTMRLRNISTTKFDYRMQEQEMNSKQHVPEEAGYIAWEPSAGSVDDLVFEIGRTSNSVTHTFQALNFYEPFTGPPVFVADMQTTDGGDTAAVRWQNKQTGGVEVKVEEEQSKDTETNHTTEVIGYMVFEAASSTPDDTQPADDLVREDEDYDLPAEGDFDIGSDPAGASDSYSLWDGTTVPTILSDSDTGAVELGVKFQSYVDGYITGLRFYKSTANTGTHVGNLWTAGGKLLSSVTFANETASGWQEMALPTPVPITADKTYVASYHTTVGRYSADVSYFAAARLDKPPLRALADGENGGNGVYLYGAGGFPNQTWNASNYWVDVVFQENVGSP